MLSLKCLSYITCKYIIAQYNHNQPLLYKAIYITLFVTYVGLRGRGLGKTA